jgi:hypothetical protein
MFNKPRGSNMAQVEYPPLQCVTKPALRTPEAAFYMNRAQQTLRMWACNQNGPLRPLNVNGRLAWPTAEVKRLMGVQ